MAIPGLKYAGKYQIPKLLYCCDLWPESMKMYIKNERNVIYRAVQRVSQHIYRSCDQIIVQSNSFIPYLMKTHGISSKKITYIPAFGDETYLTQDFTPEDETIDFVFLGNLGIAQDLISVLRAIEMIKDVPGFKVHFVGDGTMLDEMKSFVSSHGLEKLVSFYGRRPVEEMPKFYKLADACLVSLRADNATGFTLPAKVQGYMAAGKPIVGMIDGPAFDVINDSGCGLCAPAGNVSKLAEYMELFVTHHNQFQECGNNAQEYFKNYFQKSIVIKKIEEAMILCSYSPKCKLRQ